MENFPESMNAMVFHAAGEALQPETRKIPSPRKHEVLIKVAACGICRTDLHVQDAELPDIKYPVIPGHQVVGTVVASGTDAAFTSGDRVGIAWLGKTCGQCKFCISGTENLCDDASFHGYQIDGGYAQYMIADGDYCFAMPEHMPAAEAAPLLCAGLIGYRCLTMAGEAQVIGLYGFGSAAHIITQVAVQQNRQIFAFTRPGDQSSQQFALRTGATWAGDADASPPTKLDAAIIFAPVGSLVPAALRATNKGGVVICGGIHMSDIPTFAYKDLWEERQIRSVANLTREDGHEFMGLAAAMPLKPVITTYPLEQANQALNDLREGNINGTAVLVMD